MYDGGDWGVLDLTQDPVQGDPANVRALATFSQNESGFWSEHTETLTTTADYGSSMPMEGDFAPKYRDHLNQLPGRAAALRDAHDKTGTALGQYAATLDEAKGESRMALTQGMQARQQYQQAQQAYNQAIEEMNQIVAGGPYPPEVYPLAIAQWEQAQARSQQAQMFMQEAEQQRQAAKQRAMQAGQTARQAESSAAQQVRSAAPNSTADGGSSAIPAVAAGGGAALLGGGLAAAQQQLSDGGGSGATAGGWKPGDPIPAALTGDRLPAEAKLGGHYKYESDPEKWRSSGLPGQVHYMNAQEREASRLFVDNAGTMRWAKDGSVFDTTNAVSHWSKGGPGRAIFVMDKSGNVYASMEQKVGYMHHSSFLGGQNVVGAGELQAIEGRLQLMTNQSGHYQPTPGQNAIVEEAFREMGVTGFGSLSMGKA
jgi:hypothetical protein